MSRRRRQQGFTLLELMVALTVGGLVVTAVFMLGGASSRQFQEQQRIGITQRSVRMAMDRLRRDIARAGYLSVPDTRSPNVRVCPQPAMPQVQAIWFQDSDPTARDALSAVNGAANGVSADQLVLTGNYATSEGYLVRSLDSTGTQVMLQTHWLGFRNAFAMDDGSSGGSGTEPRPVTIDQARVEAVFAPGRLLHLETPNRNHFFVQISNVTVNAGSVTLTVEPGFGQDNPCIRGLGRGSIVTPISQIRYSLGPAGADLQPNNANVTGANTVLYRDELNMVSGAIMRRQPILEYAIDFNLDFIVDENTATGQPPRITRVAGAAAQGVVQDRAWQVRGVIASLAARTPEQDPRFGWPADWESGRPASAPLNRFQVFPGRDGAARVRQLRTEVQMPNMIPR